MDLKDTIEDIFRNLLQEMKAMDIKNVNAIENILEKTKEKVLCSSLIASSSNMDPYIHALPPLDAYLGDNGTLLIE